MKTGRKNKFNSADELEDKILAYFADCERRQKPYTMSGLALALGVDRKTLTNYGNKEEFFPAIKKARALVERDMEERLYSGGANTGVIFGLKNNFGWEDKTTNNININEYSLFAERTEEKAKFYENQHLGRSQKGNGK